MSMGNVNMKTGKTQAGFLIGAVMLLAAAHAVAKDPKPVGSDTRGWMQLQKNPVAQAKGPVRGMPGEAADRVYQRYLQSFTRPIPERYERDRFVGEAANR